MFGKNGLKSRLCVLFVALGVPSNSHAAAIWQGQGQHEATLSDWATSLVKGSVLILGEEHATDQNQNEPQVIRHHQNQHSIIRALGQAGHVVSVGMEFFEYPKQGFVDSYLNGELEESEFLNKVGWGLAPFDLYRPQVLEPLRFGGTTIALNIPRAITSKVAKSGHDALDSEERALLPPIWERGSAPYFERFSEAIGGHAPKEAIERYFWAQSLWDDTMAWRTSQHKSQNPETTLVIIVGQFHAEFGHGLARRLKRYGLTQIHTLLQIERGEMAEQTDPKYGARANSYLVNEPCGSEPGTCQ